MKLNYERVPNKYGIMIKKCYASCQHKCLDEFARRHCNLTRRPVRAGYVCGDWEMSEQLECLGCERGKVQRREYQLTLMEVRTSEDLAEMRGETIPPKSQEDIQREFEKENGSRFLF